MDVLSSKLYPNPSPEHPGVNPSPSPSPRITTTKNNCHQKCPSNQLPPPLGVQQLGCQIICGLRKRPHRIYIYICALLSIVFILIPTLFIPFTYIHSHSILIHSLLTMFILTPFIHSHSSNFIYPPTSPPAHILHTHTPFFLT